MNMFKLLDVSRRLDPREFGELIERATKSLSIP